MANKEEDKKAKIWFNQSFSEMYGVIEAIKYGRLRDRIEIIVSSKDIKQPFMALGDLKLEEPIWYDSMYVNVFAHEVITEEKVDIMFPKMEIKSIAKYKEVSEWGKKVICNDIKSIRKTDRKSTVYEEMAADEILSKFIPFYKLASSKKEFALGILNMLYSHRELVIKADKDEGGDTVRFVKASVPEHYDTFNEGDKEKTISVEDAISSFGLMKKEKDFIIMPKLTNEVSIDCYIGKNLKKPVVAARKKIGGRTQIVTTGEEHWHKTSQGVTLEEMAVRIGEILGLVDAPFNVQFMRQSDGDWVVTDVNPRVSGGTYMVIECGLNIPEIAIIDYLASSKDFGEQFSKDIDDINLQLEHLNFEKTVSRVYRAVVLENDVLRTF